MIVPARAINDPQAEFDSAILLMSASSASLKAA
jgi:hypothetical protein